MKIHIIGGPGRGKSFLADNLSKQFDIPHYDLDDLQWDNVANDYGTKRNLQERDALLNQILQKDDWIIEMFISHGVNNALMMLIKFIYWMFLNINADTELYADSSEENLALKKVKKKV